MALVVTYLVTYPNQYLEPRRMLRGERVACWTREGAEAHAAMVRRMWPGVRGLRVEERLVDFGDPQVRRRWERLRKQGAPSRGRPLPPPEA